MYHSVIKKYTYHIRHTVYKLYKIRLHAMTSHPGARPTKFSIDDVGRDRPGAQQTLVATPTLTIAVSEIVVAKTSLDGGSVTDNTERLTTATAFELSNASVSAIK